jgi:hypothetical protein
MVCILFSASILTASQVLAVEKKTAPSWKDDKPEEEMIHLRWKDLGEGISYQFQMAKDKEFRQIMIDKKCERPEIIFPQPDTSGIYYIRTRPLYPESQAGPFSPAQSYEINTKLLPPIINSPEEISEFRDINDITVTWSAVPHAAWYRVILARDRTFKHIVYENARVNDISLAIRNLDYGPHFLKVSAIARDGKEGPFSNTLSFIIVPPLPLSIQVK